jgi:hypothetical protein
MSLANNAKRKGDWKARIFPSGDFTIGRNQPIKSDKAVHPLDGIGSHETFYGATKVSVPDRDRVTEFKSDTIEKISIAYQQVGDQELSDRFAYRYTQVLRDEYQSGVRKPDASCASSNDDWGDTPPPPMGLSDAINSRSEPSNVVKSSETRAKRGTVGITSYGKRMTRSAAAIMENKFGRDCLSFGTATLPFLSQPENELVCQNWGLIANRFFEKLTRLLDRRGLSKDYCFVSEIQEQRFDKFGIVAPHLHWIMQGKLIKKSMWLILPCEVKEIWEVVLGNFLKRPVDGTTATRIEKPRKSLKKEMGKYLSKGTKIIKKIIDAGKGHLLPSAYHGSSRSLKKEIKAAIIILQGDECEAFIDSLESMKESNLISFIPILWEIPESGGKFVAIGFVGWVRDIETVSQFRVAA